MIIYCFVDDVINNIKVDSLSMSQCAAETFPIENDL